MSLEQLTKQFNAAFNNSQYEVAGKLLPQIKLELAKHGLLVPKKNLSNVSDLLITRDILEKGIFTSIYLRNEDEFSRLISQIHPFFYNTTYRSPSGQPALLPPSDNQYKIMALYLLLLLAKNKIAEFHTELETLSTLRPDGATAAATAASPAAPIEEILESNTYLRYPVLLERWLMEGSYHKVWKAITDSSQVPAPEFSILGESLLYTVRDEIARSAECAYVSLPIDNARHLLYLDSDDELIEFAQGQPGWVIDKIKKTVSFPSFENQDEIAAATSIVSPGSSSTNVASSKLNQDIDESAASGSPALPNPSEVIIAECLDYAREIETII
ncbi:uncharacterized protein SAPINGB_P000099 [Magnusiomyces paraingens]|uniref:PCI domain-containing protein n=1 Tax=Magnusiomyces paraingens TaxID=2606893 RepID=A0A5E8AXJ3_9ASCO|nr:uncharacterized protein SAPINGB_P000099 [Saprochaete ingens]VVT43686.1 unnamed protein product [Saprochaete ingens]